MSKTSQRKLSFVQNGYNDEKKGLPNRYNKHHAFFDSYKRGRRVYQRTHEKENTDEQQI